MYRIEYELFSSEKLRGRKYVLRHKTKVILISLFLYCLTLTYFIVFY